MGVHAELVRTVDTTTAAIDAALDLSAPAPQPLEFPVPTDVRRRAQRAGDRPAHRVVARPDGERERLVEERLVWFWHDHFATSIAKVRIPYLMWQQHLTLRQHATGNYAELLHAIARDPAMILYLDGITNAAQERNENFGRECLELFTMGRDGGYTQHDVIEASRSFTGWVVNIPGRPFARASVRQIHGPRCSCRSVTTPAPRRCSARRATFDMDGALDVILDDPSTARFVTTKLYRELVGLNPSRRTVDRLAAKFRRDYEIMPLVEAIARDDAFVSDEAVRAKYRTPVEKLVGIVQATGGEVQLGVPGPSPRTTCATARRSATRCATMSFLPFLPPNVGGYPKGARLLGPHSLVHTFDLLQAVADPPTGRESVDDLFARFGIHDVSNQSDKVVANEHDAATRLALVVTSPEYTLV